MIEDKKINLMNNQNGDILPAPNDGHLLFSEISI